MMKTLSLKNLCVRTLRNAALSLSLAGVAGLGGATAAYAQDRPAADAYHGSWKVDLAKLGDMKEIKELAADEREQGLALMKAMLSNVTFDFTERSWTMRGLGDPETMGCELASQFSTKFVLKCTKDGEKQDVLLELVGSTLYVEMPDAGRVPLTRAGSGPTRTGEATIDTKKIQGKWTFDLDAFLATMPNDDMDEETRATAIEMAKALMTDITLEITAKEVILDAMGERKAAPYKALKQDGDEIAVRTYEENGDIKETIFFEVNGRKMRMRSGSDLMFFNRK